MPRRLTLAFLFLALLMPAPGASAEDTAAPAKAPPAPAAEVADVPEGIMPLSAVRPGMRGELVTILSGTKPERFEVEVVDIVNHYLAKQDIILVRCLGETLQRIGVAQGMSGSPVYIDGKIVGALSYTWPWAKEPLAGITPIEAMLAEAARPLEGNPSGARAPTELRRVPAPIPLAQDPTALHPIGTPLSMGGFGPQARREILEMLAPMGFGPEAVSGGLVTGAPQGWANLDAPLEPGSTLVVDIVRGDLSLAAVGTCTWIEGDKILGFGHPFMSMGETLFPLSVGYIYVVMPSQNISFKLGASLREVGALVQDRNAGIIGVKGLRAPMVPVDVTIGNAVTGHKEAFHVEITANRRMFQRMLFIALRDLVAKSEGTLGPNSKTYRMTVKVKGLPTPWTYEDAVAGFDSGFTRTLMGLVDRVMIHPTQRAEFEWVKLDVEIENRDRRAFIETLTASKEDVKPGEELELLVRLRKRDGGDVVYERIAVRIPESAPEGGFRILVTGGDMVPAEAATPVDIADLPALYGAFYRSTELIAVLPTGRVNFDVGGRLMKNLPLSALPRLVRSADTVGGSLQPVTEKVRLSVPYIVVGQAVLPLNVRR